MRFHLIANFHLDPVWLWDWREGMNEALATCRTILTLMDEYPELSIVRGEAAVYEFIETHDPALFERIRAQIKSGRWDVVGGTYLQPDTNLPATEVLARHLRRGIGYMKSRLGARPTVAWCADSFGHSAGWPEIYASAGMNGFAFSRPFASDLRLPSPAFWWEGAGGARILSWRIPIGWYGSTRDEVRARLDRYREEAPAWGLRNVAIFFGLGNHGGGPTRAQINAILEWKQAHPDIAVEFSTLHRFFGALRRESAKLPIFRGELNFTHRGCYASAFAFKNRYRRAENTLLRAERTASAVAALLGHRPASLDGAWDALLFNTFHDILPGTSIERAYVDQEASLGACHHDAQRVELAALNRLARDIAISVPDPVGDRPAPIPVLIWNSLPSAFDGTVEVEVPLDYRPIDAFRNKPDEVPIEALDHAGSPIPFQCVATESHFYPEVPWRKRLLMRVQLPPSGWQVVTVGWKDAPALAKQARSDLRCGAASISNRYWSVGARRGRRRVELIGGRARTRRYDLRALTIKDPWGSWGGHDGEEEANHMNQVSSIWSIERSEVLENGPERAALWVRMRSGSSELEMTFLLQRGDPALVVRTRLLWTERAARLKLEVGAGGAAEFEVPGATLRREPAGEVPGGRWVRVGGGKDRLTFASNALYNFDADSRAFRATVVRSCRYAWGRRSKPTEHPWRPYMDRGEHRFDFALATGNGDPSRLADRLESPPVALHVPTSEGERPRSGSVFSVPPPLRLLALCPSEAGAGLILRLQNLGARETQVKVPFLGDDLDLGPLRAGAILSASVQKGPRGWRASIVTVAEEPARSE